MEERKKVKFKEPTQANLGTVYDVNKSAYFSLKPLKGEDLKTAFDIVLRYFQLNGNYLMMLCHEKRDYTIFKLASHLSAGKAVEELKECIKNRGSLVSVEMTDDNAVEIWIKDFEDAYCYYLFPYNEGVIEV